MPSDAVWIVITIPKKEVEEKRLNKKKIHYDDEKEDDDGGHKMVNVNLNGLNNFDSTDKDLPLETIVQEAIAELEIDNAVWSESENHRFHHIYFPLDLYENDGLLNFFQGKGVGVRKDSSIGYIPFGLYFCNEDIEEDPEKMEEDDEVFSTDVVRTDCSVKKVGKTVSGFKKAQEEFLKSVTSRLTVAQVVNGVRSSSELTFDFVMYAIFAGCIAAAGLLNNSAVDVAAAMMIEPVMATVIAMTFGICVQDPKLTWIGIRSCIVSLIICLIVGYIYGIIAFIWMEEWAPPNGFWPTPEMSVRGAWRTLWYGALQALAAGGAIAVTLLNDNQAALVGVAVASTFLPPFINAGLLWAYATHITVRGHYEKLERYNDTNGQTHLLKPSWQPAKNYDFIHYIDMRWEFMALSGVSMIYTLVNVVCMLAAGVLLLRIKEVLPMGNLEPHKKFFQKDIKVARDYNRRMTLANIQSLGGGSTAGDPSIGGGGEQVDELGNQILTEWAQIAGLDADTLLSDKPEARVTRRQTLFDIMSDIEGDDQYQSVTRSAVGVKKDPGSFMKRLTNGSIYNQNPATRRASMIPPTISVITSDMSDHPPDKRFTPNSSMKNSASSAKANAPMNTGIRGLRVSELDPGAASAPTGTAHGRRPSVLLQKTLKEGDHSPFSLWPARGPLSSSSSTPGGGQPMPRTPDTLRRRSLAPSILMGGQGARRGSRGVTFGNPGTINEAFERE